MYSKFNIELNDDQKEYFNRYYEIGKKIFDDNKKKVHCGLRKHICDEDTLDGTSISEEWFPSEIKSDIFISHSHKDEDLAISIVGWLSEVFGLDGFIDSMVWGYSNDLLRLIDNEYCSNGENSYNYDNRNFSTSHVHMMLSTSISKMIDKSESVFFINTPNSISVSKNIKRVHSTLSPWIYFELEMVKRLRRKSNYGFGIEIINEQSIMNFEKRINEKSLDVEYEVSLKDMVKLSDNHLKKWENNVKKIQLYNPIESIRELYKIGKELKLKGEIR